MSTTSNHWLIYAQDLYETKRPKLDEAKESLNEYQKLVKLSNVYKDSGMIKSFRCVLLCHNTEGQPCVIVKKNIVDGRVSLFGGKIKTGESVKDAMLRKIKDTILTPTAVVGGKGQLQNQQGSSSSVQIGTLLSVWHRPNFDSLVLPYLPIHCSRPKERIEVYQIFLPEKCVFQIKKKTSHLDILPIHDLTGMSTDCPILNSVPPLLGRFQICRMEKE